MRTISGLDDLILSNPLIYNTLIIYSTKSQSETDTFIRHFFIVSIAISTGITKSIVVSKRAATFDKPAVRKTVVRGGYLSNTFLDNKLLFSYKFFVELID